jgi:hypothetical protein
MCFGRVPAVAGAAVQVLMAVDGIKARLDQRVPRFTDWCVPFPCHCRLADTMAAYLTLRVIHVG